MIHATTLVCAEFDFRYNLRSAIVMDDAGRPDALLASIVGNKLAYRDSSAA